MGRSDRRSVPAWAGSSFTNFTVWGRFRDCVLAIARDTDPGATIDPQMGFVRFSIDGGRLQLGLDRIASTCAKATAGAFSLVPWMEIIDAWFAEKIATARGAAAQTTWS
jgi:hypothetical protein